MLRLGLVQGKAGRGLPYLDGAEVGDGQAVLDFFPQEGRAARRMQVAAEGDGWRLPPPDPAAYGVMDPEDAAWVRARLVPQPFQTFTQPLRLANPAGFVGLKTYIACVVSALSSACSASGH